MTDTIATHTRATAVALELDLNKLHFARHLVQSGRLSGDNSPTRHTLAALRLRMGEGAFSPLRAMDGIGPSAEIRNWQGGDSWHGRSE